MAWLTMSASALAQPAMPSERHISLEDALERALSHNYRIQMAQIDWRAAHAEVTKARSAYFPQRIISEIATTTNDPRNAFGFKLKQKVLTEAGFELASLNDPGVIDHLTIRFEFRQPVLNSEGLFRHRAARSQAQATVHALERARNDVNFQVKQSY